MASLVLYGSAVADTTLTTACKMSTATGGTETSKTTTVTGTGKTIVEVLSQGGSAAEVSAIPATPTGHGWVYSPGAGTFALGNWSAIVTLSGAGGAAATAGTLRFFKRSSAGVYTSIGTITHGAMPATKTANAFAATSMAAVTFVDTDLLYIDLWWTDTSTTADGDNPVVYESTSATAGVSSDMQITTSNFTASSGGATHFFVFDGYGGFVS